MKKGFTAIINLIKIMVLKKMRKKILKRIDEANAIHRDLEDQSEDGEMYRDYVGLMHKLKGELSVVNELIKNL